MSIQRNLRLQGATQPSAQIYSNSVFLAKYRQLTGREWTAEQSIILEQVVIIDKWLAACADHYKRSGRHKKCDAIAANEKATSQLLRQKSLLEYAAFVDRPAAIGGATPVSCGAPSEYTIDMENSIHFGKTLHQAGENYVKWPWHWPWHWAKDVCLPGLTCG